MIGTATQLYRIPVRGESIMFIEQSGWRGPRYIIATSQKHRPVLRSPPLDHAGLHKGSGATNVKCDCSAAASVRHVAKGRAPKVKRFVIMSFSND